MKKFIFVFVCCFSVHSFSMDFSTMASNLAKTAYDKYDPESVMVELKTKGVSTNNREKMTQMHRVDRIIPFFIDKKDDVKLCENITTIISEGYPVSDLAKIMASDYLWKIRPSAQSEQSLNRINDALYLINPAQIIDDLNKGQIYSKEKVDLETRVTKILERLVKLKDIDNVRNLVNLLENKSKEEGTKIVPVPRVMQEAYKFLRVQEKATSRSKNNLIKTFKVQKNDSDNEESDQKNCEVKPSSKDKKN